MRILVVGAIAAVLLAGFVWVHGKMQADRASETTFVPAPPTSAGPAGVTAVLFYPRADFRELDSFSIDLPDDRGRLPVWVSALIGALSKAPSPDVVAVFPPGLLPSSVFLDSQRNLYIDFPGAPLSGIAAGVERETMTIEALLQTVGANVPGVRSVKILVDGRDRETLFGHVDLRQPLPIRPLPRQ